MAHALHPNYMVIAYILKEKKLRCFLVTIILLKTPLFFRTNMKKIISQNFMEAWSSNIMPISGMLQVQSLHSYLERLPRPMAFLCRQVTFWLCLKWEKMNIKFSLNCIILVTSDVMYPSSSGFCGTQWYSLWIHHWSYSGKWSWHTNCGCWGSTTIHAQYKRNVCHWWCKLFLWALQGFLPGLLSSWWQDHSRLLINIIQ